MKLLNDIAAFQKKQISSACFLLVFIRFGIGTRINQGIKLNIIDETSNRLASVVDVLIIGVICTSADSLEHQIGAKCAGWPIPCRLGRIAIRS